MIILTKIDGSKIAINPDEIESVDSTHDPTITLISGRKIIVRESLEEIAQKFIEYKKQIHFLH
ncbi:MAG TPA: flagellar FlbD family protein [Bacteroidota bacterium]|nr:flagellar FlbD family protein [Candidatus Kapabacteria bacterium]HRS02130.1 flagellar FlbD family protein [Bacteroidota bacterium]HRT67155.1 flagellar FlbD family protein [Bacteroidota bacterium]